MFNLILFGPPGSGKGTQSANIIQKYGFKHLATGDMLRDEISRSTALGLQAKQLMDEGKLVPDEVVIGMIGSQLDANPTVKGFIFDGFPRTAAQAAALDELLKEKGTDVTVMLSLEVPENELITRLIERGKSSGRSDDNKETAQKRIVEYHEKTTPVADYYQAQGKLVKLEGVGTIDDIFAAISKEIDAKL